MRKSRESGESYSTTSDDQGWLYYFLRCKGSSRMTAIETLELSPWAKFYKFGLFPWKMFFHLSLIGLSTTQTILSNLHYGEYSLAVGRNWVNLFFPPDYSQYQTEFLSTSQYYIFTMNDTILDAQRLVNSYYNLPSVSVNRVVVAEPDVWETPATNNIVTPTLHVSSMKDEFAETYDLYNSTSGWPFAATSTIVTDSNQTRDYFDNLDRMMFKFEVKSFGYGSGSESLDDTCIFWDVWYEYNLSERGQVLVTNSYFPKRRCDNYNMSSRTFLVAFFLFFCSAVYLILLVKAVFNHFHIFYIIGKSAREIQLQALRDEKREARARDSANATTHQPEATDAVTGDDQSAGSGGDKQQQQQSVEMKKSFEYKPGKHYEADALVDAINSTKQTQAQPHKHHHIQHQHDASRTFGLASDYAINESSRNANQYGFDRWSMGGARRSEEAKQHEKSLLSDDRIQSDRGLSFTQTRPNQNPESFDAAFVSTDMSALRSSRMQDPADDLGNATTWDMVRDRTSTLSTIELEDVGNAWVTLSWREKLYIFNLWFVAGFAANFLAMSYCVFVLKSRDANTTTITIKALLGTACMLYWVAIAQYFEFNPRLYVLILTLKKGMPRVLQFLAGILPFFIGYALLGLSLFGDETDYFSSLRATFTTLFAVVNGDNIHNTFSALNVIPYVGDLYLAVFIIIFMYVVLMTIIAIVEEAFFSSHDSSKIDALGEAFDSNMQRFDYAPGMDNIHNTHGGGDDERNDGSFTSGDQRNKNRRMMVKSLMRNPIIGEQLDKAGGYMPPVAADVGNAVMKTESIDVVDGVMVGKATGARATSVSSVASKKSTDGAGDLMTPKGSIVPEQLNLQQPPLQPVQSSTRHLPANLRVLATQASLHQQQQLHHHHHHHRPKKAVNDNDSHGDSSNSSGDDHGGAQKPQKIGDIETHKLDDYQSVPVYESEEFSKLVSERIHALQGRSDLTPHEMAELAIKDSIAEMYNAVEN